jgi:hypothetical protein
MVTLLIGGRALEVASSVCGNREWATSQNRLTLISLKLPQREPGLPRRALAIWSGPSNVSVSPARLRHQPIGKYSSN